MMIVFIKNSGYIPPILLAIRDPDQRKNRSGRDHLSSNQLKLSHYNSVCFDGNFFRIAA